MHYINWGQESPQQIAARQQAEREWQTLVEQAINVKMRQHGQTAPAIGGGSKPATNPTADTGAGAVLYLDGTWKYLFLDYQNGTISEPVDTGVSSDYKFYARDLSGPIQDRGCVYVLATSPNFDGVNDYAIVFISSAGELVSIKYLTVNPNEGFGDSTGPLDGLAYLLTQVNEDLSSKVNLFNGDVIYEIDFPVEPGYVAGLAFSGGAQDQTLAGYLPIYELKPRDFSFEVVDLTVWLVKIEDGSKKILFSLDDIFSLGSPQIFFQTKGSLFYFCFIDESDNLTGVQAYSIEGAKLFDVDLTGLALGTLTTQEVEFYGTDNLQITCEYSDGVDTGWVLHNFSGLNNSYTTHTVPLGEYTTLESYGSTFDPYSTHDWSAAEGAINVFYTEVGSPSPTILTPVSKAKAVVHLGGETQYREHVIKTEEEPALALMLSGPNTFRDVGKQLVMISESNGQLYALTFDESLYSTDLSTSDESLTGLFIGGAGENTGITITNDLPGEKFISILLDDTGTILADTRGDFTIGANSFGTAALGGFAIPTKYLNQTSVGWQVLTPVLKPEEINSANYGSALMQRDGNLLVKINENYKPFVVTSTQVFQPDNIDLGDDTNLVLGKSMLVNTKYDELEGSYLKTLEFDGTVLQLFIEDTDETLNYFGLYGNRGLGIRYNKSYIGGTDIVLIGRNGIDKTTLVGPAEWEIIPMLNDVIWFYDYEQPEVSYFSMKINTYNGDGQPQFTIPTAGGGYNYQVFWTNSYDSNSSGIINDCTGDCFISFPENSEYIIKIYGDFPRIFFNGTGDCQKLTDVLNWGKGQWTSMQAAFKGCTHLPGFSAPDLPDLSQVEDMSEMFQGAVIFNDTNIDNWNVSSVTDLSYMFDGALAFNKNLNNWYLLNATTMEGMFRGAIAFNGNIGGWYTANVVNMSSMFENASSFNFDISGWNTVNVTDMSFMFSGATVFSQNLSTWNTGNVTTMRAMFAAATNFDANLMNWNTSNVTDMSSMFSGATTFGSNLASLTWNTSNVTDMSTMFNNAVNFRGYGLPGWNTANVVNMSGMFANAILFDQGLSGWCVTLIPSAPVDFDTGASSWVLSRPVWGSCPVPA